MADETPNMTPEELERLRPQPFLGQFVTYFMLCEHCGHEWETYDKHVVSPQGCPKCDSQAWVIPGSVLRNINAWSLTPRGEKLGPVEPDTPTD
jgi:hypothetical protein